jgi:tyrosine-protein kinase Etk/Wzc
MSSNEQKNQKAEDKINQENATVGNTFVEFLTVTVRYRWFLFWFVFIITVSATTYALLSPKWYKASASVLPAEKTDFLSAFSGLSSLARNFSSGAGLASALSGNTEFDRYIAILKSATMTDDVITKFDLRKEYEMQNAYYEKVVKAYNSNLEIEVADEGNLSISFYDKSPQRAAEITNYLINKLNEINTRLSATNARANRIFIEKRYTENVADINRLEEEMKKFQIKYGVIAVPEQIEATVKTMATIYGELAQKEIEYNVLKRQYGDNSPLTTAAGIQVEELKKHINSQNAGTSGNNTKLLIPFKQAPELSDKYLKIYRDLEIQYKILELVQPLYEQAKVEEARNSPSVLVLDKAYPPDRKSRPKGTIYAMVSFVSSMVIGYLIVFIIVLFQKIKKFSPQSYSYITSSIKKDLFRIGIKKK